SCLIVLSMVTLIALSDEKWDLKTRGTLIGTVCLTALILYRLYIVLQDNNRLYLNAERSRLKAEQASSAKAAFLAKMSHELRTPLHGVIGMSDLLLKGNLEESQRGIGENIRGCGNLLLDVINEILDFSKIESGKVELQQTVFDLHQCIDEAM